MVFFWKELNISQRHTGTLLRTLVVTKRKRDSFKQLVAYPDTDWKSAPAKELLSGMLMTACDLGAICKPWDIQQVIADLVAQEFFEQGDLEQQKFGAPTAPMFDRSKYPELPKMQVGFIDFICTPLYKALTEKFPDLAPLLDGSTSNRDNWQLLNEGKGDHLLSPALSNKIKEVAEKAAAASTSSS